MEECVLGIGELSAWLRDGAECAFQRRRRPAAVPTPAARLRALLTVPWAVLSGVGSACRVHDVPAPVPADDSRNNRPRTSPHSARCPLGSPDSAQATGDSAPLWTTPHPLCNPIRCRLSVCAVSRAAITSAGLTANANSFNVSCNNAQCYSISFSLLPLAVFADGSTRTGNSILLLYYYCGTGSVTAHRFTFSNPHSTAVALHRRSLVAHITPPRRSSLPPSAPAPAFAWRFPCRSQWPARSSLGRSCWASCRA